MAAEQLPAEGRAAVLAAAVRLISARRTGMPTTDFAGQVLSVLFDLDDRYPEQRVEAFGWLVGQLATTAARACDEWNKAAGGTPAEDWLAAVGAHAAVNRS